MALHYRLLVAGLSVLVIITGIFGFHIVNGQTNDAREQPSAVKYDLRKARYFGVQSCVGCHSGIVPYPNSKDFIRLDEYKTWFNEDKHSLGYEVLSSERSRQMGRLLGIDPLKSDSCLNCHTINIPAELRGDDFSLKDGVSCDGCHGQSEHWFGPHIQRSWRLQSGKQKEEWGMANLRDPVARARLCISCHVGSVFHNRIITHEMYAAGHPPLPGFELASFSDMLPRHWRLIREVPFINDPILLNPPEKFKDSAVLKKFVQSQYHHDIAPFEETRLAVIGGVVVFQESMHLLAAHARKTPLKHNGPEKTDERLEWPELARYDCYACHHDLKSPSWRQKAGYPGASGRPYMHAWPTVLVRLAIRQTAGTDDARYQARYSEFQVKLKRVYDAFAEQPFGVADKIAPAAEELAAWSETLLEEVRNARLDRAACELLASDLLELGKEKYLDYDSARQVAWAFTRIHGELLGETTAPENYLQAKETLSDNLYLRLPPGKKAIVEQLPTALEKLNGYQPEQVMTGFQKMAAALGVKKE